MYVRFRRRHRNVIWPLIQQSVVLKDVTRGHVFVNIHSNSTYIFKKYILYGEKVSRGQKIAKFYVFTFANDLRQLISRKINFRDQQKSAFRVE